MLRQYGKAVEQSFGCRVRARQCESHRVLIEFGDLNRLAINDQQVALRGINCFIHVKIERENNVVRVERVPVGKAYSFAELKSKNAAVG